MRYWVLIACFLLVLTGCQRNPTFHETKPANKPALGGAAFGALGGLMISTVTSTVSAPLGIAVGAALGYNLGQHYDRIPGIANIMQKNGAQTVTLGDTTTVYLPSDRLFYVGEANLRPEGRGTLTQLSKIARIFGHSPIVIIGHTDNVMAPMMNYQLAKERAESVAAYLWAAGINQKRFKILSDAGDEPIASNRSLWGSRMNRRVEVVFHKLNA